MTDLHPGAGLVVRLAKRGDSPERSDRERVREALDRTLRRDRSAASIPLTARRRARVGVWSAVAVLTVSVVAAAATATVVARRWAHDATESPPPQRVAPPTVRPAPPPASPQAAVHRTEASARVEDSPARPPAPSAASHATRTARRTVVPVTLTLADEAALLRRARDALAAGNLDGARNALAEHRRRAPSGALAEDREALRVLVSCRGDRDAEKAARFAQRWPGSAHEGRLARECGTVDR
jgi:hypothetical protein